MAPSVKQTDKKTPSRLQEGERACAMKLRVYPTSGQEHRLGQWVYCAKRFRNEAVAFCAERRKARAIWLRQNPNLAQDGVPEGLSGFDANACSKWLTSRLRAARLAARMELGIACSERKMMETVHRVLSQLSPGEKNDVEDAWLLTVPRTVFDQVLQDMGKTEAKATADRKKTRKAGGKNEPSGNRKSRGPKLAGFPQFRKWRYPGSIRLQVSAEKNTRFRDHWEAGEVFIPGLGLLKFRDQGYVLPKTPPALITLSRDAAGHFHVAFLCVEKEYAQIKPGVGQGLKPLPLDPETGFPVACAIDLSLTHLGVDDQGQSLGRKRHLKRFARALRRKNQSLARKQKGSQRWHKARRELGRLHVRIANCREAELRVQAKALVDRSAIVCLENYFLAFMLQNSCLAESTHDAGLYRFKQLIEQQCAKQGKLLLQCGRFDASTQICSACNYKHTALKNNLKLRSWTCPGCEVSHDRDHNAAINILLMALTRAIGMQDVLSGPENCPGVPKASRVRLHPDLAAFIARGGLTAIVDHTRSTMRRRAEHPLRPGLDGAHEARVSPKQPEHGRLERSGAG